MGKIKLDPMSDIEQADEINKSFVSIQRPKEGKPCFFVLAGEPQSINPKFTLNETFPRFASHSARKEVVLASLVMLQMVSDVTTNGFVFNSFNF